MKKKFFRLFFAGIIASILLGVNGCGYKVDPYYQKKVPLEDKNVEFYIQKKELKHAEAENNESCN